MFNLGPPIGQALGVAFGAKIAAAYDWRLAFIVLGVAGVIAAAMVWAVIREPGRGATDAQVRSRRCGGSACGAAEVVELLGRHCGCLRHGRRSRLVSLACGRKPDSSPMGPWVYHAVPDARESDDLDEIAIWYALVLGICVSAGIFLSGRLIDRFAPHSPQVYGLLPGDCARGGVPFFIGFVHGTHLAGRARLPHGADLSQLLLSDTCRNLGAERGPGPTAHVGRRGAPAHHEPDRVWDSVQPGWEP